MSLLSLRRARCALLALLCALPFASPAGERYVLSDTLLPDPPLPRHSFGSSFDLDGDAMVIANTDSSPADDPDDLSIHVYRRVDGSWQREARLRPYDKIPVALNTAVVAISGDTVVIGTPRSGTLEEGRAYLWGRDPLTDSWRQIRVLKSSQPSRYANFGSAVDIHRNTLVVGSPFELGPDGVGRGAAHVFQRGSEGWRHARTINPPLGAAEVSNFGEAVAIDNSRIVVGAPFSNSESGAEGAGAALVYSRNLGGTGRWGLLARVQSPDAQALEHCGRRVRVSGHRVAVSCPEAGQVWLHRVGSATPPALITPPSADHALGYDLDFRLDRLAVTARASGADSFGLVEVYDCPDLKPLQCGLYDTLSLGAEHPGFGAGVALDDAGALAIAVDDQAGSEFENGGVLVYEDTGP